MTVEVGLRERKKAATRAALSAAAMRLTIEHGVEAVTAEAIAAAADVSPRTFHNYFSCKEEAIVSPLFERGREVGETLRARPAGEPIWDALEQAVMPFLLGSEVPLEGIVALVRRLQASPALVAHELCGFADIERELVQVIADRTGTEAERDLYPHLLAATVGVAMRTALELWAQCGIDAEPADLVREAFAQMRAGLPAPDRERSSPD
jgi:AcrR family transcriptional regulator